MGDQNVKAKLKLVLWANKVIVAETTDHDLWQSVFSIITARHGQHKDQGVQQATSSALTSGASTLESNVDVEIRQFAKELEVTNEVLIAACNPQKNAPYLHLDVHYWEALKANTPQRGPNAVGPIILAATLLVLWARHTKSINPAPADALVVLETIDLHDRNCSRTLKQCEWLQRRDGGIKLNPTLASKAIQLARAYCTKTSIQGDKSQKGK